MKKLSTLLLALLATTALWAADFTVGGIAYNFLGSDSVEVTSNLDDYSGSISIPPTVTYKSTTYRVTSIGGEAFYDCSSLTSITIPNSVTSIGGWAFYNCTSLTSVTIDNNYILNTEEPVSNIFGSQVQTYIIGNSVTSIGFRAFWVCTFLSSITVDAANAHYASEDGVLFNYAKDTLIQYPIGNTRTSYTIPNSVTSIGYRAFYYCTSLSSIYIPNSVTSIGTYAFCNCTSLSSVTVDAANTHYISVDGVLFNYAKDTLIQYPIGNTRTSYTIPNSVTSIGGGAFCWCTSLSSVTIPNSVTSIGGWAFSFTSLKSITIPNSVTSIGEGAFEYCDSLSSVTIPNSVTSIGKGAFAYCTSLSSVTIPNSVTSIGEYAFYDCSSLTSITIPNSVISIGGWAFSDCKSLSSITIPNSVTSIGEYAFYDCKFLSSITCYATTPPGCGRWCFYKVDKSIPVYVPEGSIDAYKAADEWKDFTNIQAISTPTDIKNVNANENANENHKVMKNGQVVILHNNHTYTLSGTPIK